MSDKPGPSELSEKLQRLRRATLNAAEKREKIPVPLFWSLFHSQIRDVRKVREHERKLRAMFLGTES